MPSSAFFEPESARDAPAVLRCAAGAYGCCRAAAALAVAPASLALLLRNEPRPLPKPVRGRGAPLLADAPPNGAADAPAAVAPAAASDTCPVSGKLPTTCRLASILIKSDTPIDGANPSS